MSLEKSSIEKPTTATPEFVEKEPETADPESTGERPETPDQEPIRETEPGKNKEELGEKNQNQKETAEKTALFLSPENQEFLNKLSGGGKEIMSMAYERIREIPGESVIVGKMGIAYNRFWMDHHEKKAVGLKNKIDGFDLKIKSFDQSKKEIESVIENLKQQNIPGTESLQIKMREIDRQKMDLLNKKSGIQSKLEAREDKINLYVNERDRIADNLISNYNEKLEPMEKDLENLRTQRDQAESLIADADTKYKERTAKLEEGKAQLEKALRGANMSEREIRKFSAVKIIDVILKEERRRMRVEKKKLLRKKAKLDKKIAKINAEANPYRDKREEFVRIKEDRPIEMNIEARERKSDSSDEGSGGREKGKTNMQEESFESDDHRTAEEAYEKMSSDDIEKDKDWQTASSYVSGWNTYLQEKYGRNSSEETVDLNDFIQTTKLSGNYKLDFENFKNTLINYYKLKKMPTDKLNKSIDMFFEKKIKAEK